MDFVSQSLLMVAGSGDPGSNWIATLGGASSDFGRGMAVDSADNVYIVGETNSAGAGADDIFLAKYSSAGAIQWQRTLGGASDDFGYGVAVDSADNVYIVGYTRSTGAGNYDAFLAKYSSAGAIQWQRTLGGASSDFSWGVAVDSAANVYIVGETNSAGAGADDTFLAKYSSAGVIQWQRTLGGASSDFSWGVAVDSAANVYIVGSIGADSLLAKLPSDGTGEGTYGGLTYQASNLTASTSTLTASTSNLTSSLSSLTSSLSNLTSSISNLTSTTTPI